MSKPTSVDEILNDLCIAMLKIEPDEDDIVNIVPTVTDAKTAFLTLLLEAMPEKRDMSAYESDGVDLYTNMGDNAVGEQLVQLAKFADDKGFNQAIEEATKAFTALFESITPVNNS